MSVESARAFLNRMSTDKEFFQKISTIPVPEDRRKAILAEGFDFDRQDAEKLLPPGLTLEQAMSLNPNSSELPDAMLEAVAGGKSDAAIVGGVLTGVGAAATIAGAVIGYVVASASGAV